MSERTSIRGHAPRGARGGRGDHRGGRGGGAHGAQQERPKKENILDLSKYADKKITVKFSGGREGAMDNMPAAGNRWANNLVLQLLEL